MSAFTEAEINYLGAQMLGRLATIAPDGQPQNNPVTFRHNHDAGTIDIGGREMPVTRKFRNVQRNPHVSFVVDDLESIQPWKSRFIEIRGHAEALADAEPLMPGMSRGIIRIRPHRIIAFGIDPDIPGRNARDV